MDDMDIQLLMDCLCLIVPLYSTVLWYKILSDSFKDNLLNVLILRNYRNLTRAFRLIQFSQLI